MYLSSSSHRSVRRPNANHSYAANALGIHLPPPATQCVPPSMLIPQTPAVDTSDRFPPTPRIPTRELPPLPPSPQPLFQLHPILTDVTFHWDVRLSPAPPGLPTSVLSDPAFESPRDLRSLRLHFRLPVGARMPAMDCSCDVAVPEGALLTIGDVFRALHDAVRAALTRALRRRTAGCADVLGNVDLPLANGQYQAGGRAPGGGLYFHGIVVDQTRGAYPVFRAVLRDYPPFAQGLGWAGMTAW